MKIGIIGLRPRQISDLRHRKFNGHEVSFFDDKSFTQEHVASFCRHADHIVVIVNGVPKNSIDWVPYAKRHAMHGSVSTVLSYLNGIAPDAEGTIHGLNAVAKTIVSAKPEAEGPRPPPKIGMNVPPGYTSQYQWKFDIGIVQGDALSKRNRFELLDAAEPGDIVRYARPADTRAEPAVWRNRVNMIRTNRLKKGQLIESHFYEDYVDLFVMVPHEGQPLPQLSVKTKSAAAPVTIHMPEQVKHPAGATVDGPQATVASTVAQPRSAPDPEVMQSVADDTAKIPPLPDPKCSQAERGLWRQAYLAAIAVGQAQQAAIIADQCLLDWCVRFKPAT